MQFTQASYFSSYQWVTLQPRGMQMLHPDQGVNGAELSRNSYVEQLPGSVDNTCGETRKQSGSTIFSLGACNFMYLVNRSHTPKIIILSVNQKPNATYFCLYTFPFKSL